MDMGLLLDVAVILVVIGSVAVAIIRGFIREILTIFGIVGSIIASYIGGPALLPHTRNWLGVTEAGESAEKLFNVIPYPFVAYALAYGIVLIIFLIIFSVMSHYISKGARNMGLGALDRSFGALFGFVRAAVLLAALYSPFYYLVPADQKDEWFAQSYARPQLESLSRVFDGYVPDNVEEKMMAGVDDVSGSETRKRFEAMDVLPKSDSLTQPLEEGLEKNDGYSHDFRSGMDLIIEQVNEN